MVIAHRGASGHAPENTIAAFQKAIDLGAHYLEIDLHLSQDGEMVVIHDSSVDRTTNGKGDVAHLTLIELKKLDAGLGEKIPTLKEVFELIKNQKIKMIIEIKDGHLMEDKLIKLIREYHYDERVILKSFKQETLLNLKKLAPKIPQLLVFVFAIPSLDFVLGTRLYFDDLLKWQGEYLQEHRFFMKKSYVESMQQNGHKVIGWGVNSESEIKEMLEMGVDGIETDYPDRVLNLQSSQSFK